MDSDEYRRMAENAGHHWWYASTRALLRQVIEPHLDALRDPVFLDAAGGTGATGSWLNEFGPTVLADYDESSLLVAAGNDARYSPTRADLNHLPFADDAFSLVLCVTALYHRLNPDPAAIVADYARIVRPGGLVCLMEPAGKRLYRSHDEVTHTARRFQLGEMRAMAQAAELEIVTSTCAYSFLLPPAALMSWRDRHRHSATSDVDRHQSGLGGVLGVIAAAERRLLRHVNLPIGLSAVVLARRPRRSVG